MRGTPWVRCDVEFASVAQASKIAPKVLGALTRPGVRRPLVLRGRSGSGKTTLLRTAVEESGREAVWCSAIDLAHDMVEAIREGRHEAYRAGLAEDPRALCVEHLEDLRDRPRTREEVRHMLERAARTRPILLTLTHARGHVAIARWLRPWTEIVLLDSPRRAPDP